MGNDNPPGHPGILPRWTSSRKSAIGNSLSYRSRVWFTISHGILNEIYYPTVDNPCTRDMGFIVTSGDDFFSEEKRDARHETTYLQDGIPAYRSISTCKEMRYRIIKTIFCNTYNNTLIQKIHFKALKGSLKDYKLFALLSPHINGFGQGNDAWKAKFKDLPLFYASKYHTFLAMASSSHFVNGICGFVGTSDGWLDLKKNKRLTQTYDSAKDGNVAITGEIDLEACDGEFTLVISFGSTYSEAGREAKGSLMCPCDDLLKLYMKEWEEKLGQARKLGGDNPKTDKLYKASLMVLNTHKGKNAEGSIIASLSIPWGSSKGDNDLGGYHLIWPRDLVEIATGFLASDDEETTRRILHFLICIQEEDGHFAQCLWHNGYPYWNNIQMDETALPILLADILKRNKALGWVKPWPMISKAAAYIAQNGPVTAQDRWEEDGGYTPFTLSVEIAALLVAADSYDEEGLTDSAHYLRELADNWNSNIEKWMYVSNTELANKVNVEGYYVRITPETSNSEKIDEPIIEVKNRQPDHQFNPASKIISTDALALVRFGLRSPEDPCILNTIKVIDALLKKETRNGPVWRRYNEDGYGEHNDGSPFDGTGIGRGWPLLVGERAHYEVIKGNMREAKHLLHSMTNQAGTNALIPEQIWDNPDLDEKELFNGEATKAAQPLVWAHSEYIKLLRSIADDKAFDMPPQTVQRYQFDKKKSPFEIWRFNHKCNKILQSKILRVELCEPATVIWSIDNFKTKNQIETKDSGVGIHYSDIPTEDLNIGDNCQFQLSGIKNQTDNQEIYNITIYSQED